MTISQEIKHRLDIVEIVQEYLPLRKSGNSFMGFCPFHTNTRTPSFVVFPDSQTWRCFGACAEGGDLFSFLMKKEGWEFKETLRYLADRAGIELTETTLQQQQQQQTEERLMGLLESAADYFHQLYLYAPQAEGVRRYIAKRQFRPETVEEFKIGYALDSWDNCRNHFMGQGYTLDDLLEVGLLSKNEEQGTTYDRFRHRLMIPIRNSEGHTVGFGARTLDPNGLPKYLNSPETGLFHKSHLLFGLDFAKRHIREARQVVIVEGYMDTIQAHQMGFKNVVAQMGTALTSEQLDLVKRYTKRFVIALDGDSAGIQATLRSLEVARQHLDRADDPQFDLHGLIKHEGRLQADIRILTLPDGKDPDDLIRTDPSKWAQLVETAKPIVEYVIEAYTTHLDLNDAKAKSQAAQQILPMIADVSDPIEREHYRQMLARTLRIDERTLLRMPTPESRQSKPERRSTGNAGTPPTPSFSLRQTFSTEKRETHYLRQIIAYPRLIHEIDHLLRDKKMSIVSEADFSITEDGVLFRYIKNLVYTTGSNSIDQIESSLDRALQERLSYIQRLERDPDIPKLVVKVALSILDCRLEKKKKQLQFMNEMDKTEGEFAEYKRTLLRDLSQIHESKTFLSSFYRRELEAGK